MAEPGDSLISATLVAIDLSHAWPTRGSEQSMCIPIESAPLVAKPELVQIRTASKQQAEGEKAQQLRRNQGGEAV
jgi:hypothetical protein